MSIKKKQSRLHQFFETKDGIKIFFISNFKKADPDKPVIIFNYGLVCNTTQWDKQYDFFQKEGFQVVLHDYRFHHRSSSGKNLHDLTIRKIASDINALIKHIGACKVILFGNSMGVNVCLEYMKRYSKKTIAAVFISGSIKPPQEVMFDTNLITYVAPFIEFVQQKLPRLFNTVWRTLFFNPLMIKSTREKGFNKDLVPEEVIVHYLKKIGELAPGVFFQLFKEMNDHKIDSYLSKVNVPVLIIGGNKDKIIPPYLQRILHRKIKKSEIYILKEGSHMPHMEFPDKINKR
ncbi:MAG: hypothetical protein A2328_02575, partial [Bdellovibrionales bacterium RIFOXYB2_FULL_36_6]